MTAINQKEYLKKYLSIGSKDGKKKKRKKKIPVGDRVKIIDDDIDISNLTSLKEAADLFNTNEDAPQVVGVIDERPLHLRIDDYRKSDLWKPVGVQENEGHKQNHAEEQQKNDDDFSPPRQKMKISHSGKHQRREERRYGGDSPTRKRNKKDERSSLPLTYIRDGNSPPGRTHKKSVSSDSREQSRNTQGTSTRDFDATPPRKENVDYSLQHRSRRNCGDSPPRKSRWNSEGSATRKKINSSPDRKNDVDHGAHQRNRKEDDNSPPRRLVSDLDSSPRRRRDRSLSRRSRTDDDNSPPRKSKRDYDNSPPRKSKRADDNSPPRKSRKDDDNSPPRKSKRDDGNSPPRRSRRDNDTSLPRRSRKDGNSPPQRNRENFENSLIHKTHCEDTDNSPPRRSRKNDDNSPPRRSRRNSDTGPVKKSIKRENSSPSRASSSRMVEEPKRKMLPGDKKGKYLIPAKRTDPNTQKMGKTLDGKSAGLQSKTQLVNENEAFRRREDELFKNMSSDVSGANAAPIMRDRKTGKIRDLQKEAEECQEKEKQEEENKEKYSRWGRGLRQVEAYEDKLAEDLHEMSKPLARYADDEDLEKFLKEQEREGDPMLAYIRKKRKKKIIESGKPLKPQYEGEFMPNRFGIVPGHRWDGVDRSNGYEKKWFEVQNAKRAQQEEIYKWSTEDM